MQESDTKTFSGCFPRLVFTAFSIFPPLIPFEVFINFVSNFETKLDEFKFRAFKIVYFEFLSVEIFKQNFCQQIPIENEDFLNFSLLSFFNVFLSSKLK